MSTLERSLESNNPLIDKVRAGTSPTPKNRRDRFSYGYKKSNEDSKIRIQKDILDSLKESDGLPALVYPQDYIFDIAHLRTNGNLGEIIDDMSNIVNPEERFEMVKSENRILRERLHNALQREMKAIKTFQKLAHDNRLMHLKLKEYENTNKARLLNSGKEHTMLFIYLRQVYRNKLKFSFKILRMETITFFLNLDDHKLASPSPS